jgi:hypothetical protein
MAADTASAWRAVLGDVGKRLDGFWRVLARKLLDAVGRFGASTRIAALAFLKASVHLFWSCSQVTVPVSRACNHKLIAKLDVPPNVRLRVRSCG